MSIGVYKLLFSHSSSSWLCLLHRRPHIYRVTKGPSPWQHQSRILSVPLDHPLFLRPHSCTLTNGPRPWQHQSRILSVPLHQPLSYGIPALYHSLLKNISIKEKNLPNALTILQDIKAIPFAPMPFLLVSLSGLIPFMVPPAYMIMTQAFIPKLAWAQSIFGAAVLSFVGGVRWGYIFPKSTAMKVTWLNMAYSIAPCTLGCISLMMPQTMTTLTLMVGITGASYIDAIVDSVSYPSWYKGVRLILSALALMSLWTTIMCKVTLSEGKETNAKHKSHSLTIRAEDDYDQGQETGADNTKKLLVNMNEGLKEETEHTVKVDEHNQAFFVIEAEGWNANKENAVKTDGVSVDAKQNPFFSKSIKAGARHTHKSDGSPAVRSYDEETLGDDFFSRNI